MGIDDKVNDASDKAMGAAKDNFGKLMNDKQNQAEGKAQKAKGSVKETGEKAKDALKDAAD